MKYSNEHAGKEICLFVKDELPCIECGELTGAIDWSEARVCSTECMTKFNDKITAFARQEQRALVSGHCPWCGETLYDGPFCSDCGDVAGLESEMYELATYSQYEERQIKSMGRMFIEPKHYVGEGYRNE